MKLQGEFVVRQIMDEVVAIPVGDMALKFNGMILLNQVSRVIWQCLEQETDIETMTAVVTDSFEVTAQEARADIVEFVEQLRAAGLLSGA